MAWDMKIIIPGKPIAKARARHANRGKYVMTYDPQDKDKKIVRSIMTSQVADIADSTDKMTYMQLGKICASKVFSVQFIFFLPINQSDSVIARNKKLWGITRASTKPDYDNLEKFYLDCANGVLWGDDSCVIQGKALKLYSEEPRVEIVINAVEDLNLNKKLEDILCIFSPSELEEFNNQTKEIRLSYSQAHLEKLGERFHADWCQSIACLLSKFAVKYAQKLNKIAKIGDIESEIKQFEEYKSAL